MLMLYSDARAGRSPTPASTPVTPGAAGPSYSTRMSGVRPIQVDRYMCIPVFILFYTYGYRRYRRYRRAYAIIPAIPAP